MSQRSRFQPPELYSIHQGTVTRIEPYGCFVKLSPSPTTSAISGLVHISHLHSNKISDVNDVVNLDDLVFVKVIDVQVEQIESDRGDGHGGNSHNGGGMRQRHKIKLSMKYVHQDTGEDLDKDNLQLEEDMFRTRDGGSKGRGGNSGNPTEDGTYGANSQLGRALASNIGMSSALDPGNLILKGKGVGGGGSGQLFNGYEMVGEEEGEPDAVLDDAPAPVAGKKPMGRGRGTTLPAWMTRQDKGDRLGSMNDELKVGNMESIERPNGNNSDESRHDHDKLNKRSKRDRRDKHHKREKHHRRNERRRHHTKEDRQSRRHRDPKKHKKNDRPRRRHSRSRSRSPSSSISRHSSCSEHSYYDRKKARESFSRSRSPSRLSPSERRSGESRHRKRKVKRSRSRSPSREEDGHDFANVDEARAIMDKLERRRLERETEKR
mmetsp:Transcript_1142/g.2213  ORF Transcript_1142/g.2213 Transcript_1142/m.2213 type:complete len:435 (-) Transcript_1142:100-1404(-)